jgi:hypothetical protein
MALMRATAPLEEAIGPPILAPVRVIVYEPAAAPLEPTAMVTPFKILVAVEEKLPRAPAYDTPNMLVLRK